MTDYDARIGAARERMCGEGVSAFLFSNPINLRWLSGFTGSSGFAYLNETRKWLAVDSRYYEQAGQQCPGWEIKALGSSAAENLAELLVQSGAEEVGVEADHLTVAAFQRHEAGLNGRVRLKPVTDLVRNLRAVKDRHEVAMIRQACRIVDEAFDYICGVLKPGLKERDVLLELEWRIRKNHGAGIAFPSIVVSGERTSLPHGQPTDKVIAHGDLVTLDFGAQWEGYCSDLTRTVVIGAATDEQKRIHRIVLEAQQRAIGRMKAGAEAKMVDAEARGYIAEAGHGEHFGHGLGHGVGLEVHDSPGLGPKSEVTLREGMVLTVEPGIYIPSWGGVRIEDDVLVTPEGCEILTSSPRDLLEL